MKKNIIFFLFLGCNLYASEFEEVRRKTFLGTLPPELIKEVGSFNAQQVFQEIQSAKTYEEALQKVRHLGANPILENPKIMDSILFHLGQKFRRNKENEKTDALTIATELNIPAAQHWIKEIYPLEEKLFSLITRLDTKAIQDLLDKGVNIEAITHGCFQTPLLHAVYMALLNKNYLPMVTHLLDKKANVNAQDCAGETVLSIATHYGNEDMAKLLIERGANPLIKNIFGSDPFLVYQPSPETERIIAHILPMGLKNASLSQRLFFAIRNKNVDNVKNLIEKDHADVNARDEKQKTPLMEAESLPILRYLLEHGADVNAKDLEGNTALVNEASLKYPDTQKIELLLNNHADPSIKNTAGLDAVQAITKVHSESRSMAATNALELLTAAKTKAE